MIESKPQPSTEPVARTRIRGWYRRLFLRVFSSALLIGAVVLWWATAHIDRNGRLPKPVVAIGVPGGFFQARGLQDGLHVLCMRNSWRRGFSVQFESMSYLGNAGYHYGELWTCGGFTFVLLTETIHDYDVIQSPYAAMVFPYWFLVSACACLLLYSLGLLQWLLLAPMHYARRILSRNERGADR